MIYGVAALAACMFCGEFIGNILGLVLGTGSDIGGVGFAMLFLIILSNSEKFNAKVSPAFHKGIEFWKAMYIPVVIAMAASQNVYNALSGGLLAIICGLAAVAAAFGLLPLINKAVSKKTAKSGGEAK